MSNLPEKNDGIENPADEYAVAPLPPEIEKRPPLLVPIRPVKPYNCEPPPKVPFQFTLADLFALTAAVAVFMSVLSSINILSPKSFAGTTGLGAVISLILLAFWPSEQPLVRLGWWVLFVLYLLACIGALIFG